MDAFKQLKRNLARAPSYEDEGDDVQPPSQLPVRLFAFYLPQFHPIVENDDWWGKGFTEWTNVTKALPRFAGHYQPHLPADLGFYDLRTPESVRAQVALAKRYGIAGFCFHWFWFGGRRLLERPLEVFLAQQDVDFPFFVNWANENWTRRWDGREDSVLMRQQYSADDDIAVADAFLALMKDRRYLRIDGRPVVMVYRPSDLPDAQSTIRRWREHFAARGERDPLVLMPQVYDSCDPRPFGMDAAVQFLPHQAGAPIENAEHEIAFFPGSAGGTQFDYETVADRACDRKADGYPLFRGVCPSWDNEARKPNSGSVLVGATPRAYGRWLGRAIRSTLQERPLGTDLVFVNAWNEWAEGAHLEPDRHHGHAFLRTTCRALNAARSPSTLDDFVAGASAASASAETTEAANDFREQGNTQASAVRPSDRTTTGSPDDNGRGLAEESSAERYAGHTDDPFEVAGMLRAWMPSASRVLDIGCGTGSVTMIANRYKKNDVICIEPDPERAARAEGRQLYVHCGTLDDGFIRRYGLFDVVMMSDVLEHFADLSSILTLIRSALRPDGTLLISVPNVAHWSVRLSLLIGRFEYAPTGILDATHLRWFTEATIQRLMRDAGFEVVRIAQTAGQDLPEYHYQAPWRWMAPRVRNKLVRIGTRALPRLFGCQHVLLCRRIDAANGATAVDAR